ncbi:hypothetical protein IAD21_01188 [Abditibacteriota bacterium]|nr:hypothetical protein IAD21_01188 [Abditibacteriota bacterium]
MSSPTAPNPEFDLLRVPVIGRFLSWRRARLVLQIPLFAIAFLMVAQGLTGSQLSPKNLATVLTWVHYRGALIVVLMVAGNFFCLGCPFVMVRDVARRFVKPKHNWPQRLQNKWLALGLFVLVLFCYELFDLWGSPLWTAVLILAYFVGALIIDTRFKHATFCKFVCPIGQFNFVASTLSPLEVKVRDLDVCSSCKTKDCIKSRQETTSTSSDIVFVQRGCELALFQPLKVGNLDCTFCLDCVHACPHENVGILARTPASELWNDQRRSGVGQLSKRNDFAALSAIFTFGALLNAFGMVSPVYAVETWLSRVLGITSETPILGLIFVLALVVEPMLLLGGAALATRQFTRTRGSLLTITTTFAPTLIPLGCGMWLAHYTFHLLTGLWTFIPVFQYAFQQWGMPILGAPNWSFGGIPVMLVKPLEWGFLALGVLGSLLVAHNIAKREHPTKTTVAFLPWAILSLILWFCALWLLSQPMEMRATLLSS